MSACRESQVTLFIVGHKIRIRFSFLKKNLLLLRYKFSIIHKAYVYGMNFYICAHAGNCHPDQVTEHLLLLIIPFFLQKSL